jgi:hypothetical protein
MSGQYEPPEAQERAEGLPQAPSTAAEPKPPHPPRRRTHVESDVDVHRWHAGEWNIRGTCPPLPDDTNSCGNRNCAINNTHRHRQSRGRSTRRKGTRGGGYDERGHGTVARGPRSAYTRGDQAHTDHG